MNRNNHFNVSNRRTGLKCRLFSRRLLALAAASALTVGGLTGVNLHAATQTWAPGGVDGSGNWDTSTSNWNPGSTTWVNGSVAAFGLGGNSSQTVTIDTTGITAGGLTFNTMGSGAYYTIAGTSTDNLTLSNASGVNIVMNANATITAPVTIDNNLLVSGNHTLTVSGGGFSFASGVTVTFGTGNMANAPTVLGGGGGGGGSSPNLIFDGGTFQTFDLGQGVASLISEGGSGIYNTFDANNNGTSGVESSITQTAAGTTFVLQDGTINMVADNSSSFNAGTLQIGSANSANPTNVVFGYQVSSNNNSNLPASNVTISLDDGMLTQASGNVTINSNTYTVDTASNTLANNLVLGGASDTINAGTANALILTGAISGTGPLTLNSGSSSQTVALTGNNTYSGGTTIDGAGGAGIGSNTAFGTGGVTIGSNGNSQIKYGSSSLTIANSLTLAAASNDTINMHGNSDTWSGVIGGSGALTVIDSHNTGGQLTLSGVNTYTGGTTVGDNTNSVSLNLTGSLANSNITILSHAGMTGTGTLNWNLVGDTGNLITADGGLTITNLNLDIHTSGTQTQSQYVVANYTGGSLTGSSFASVLGLPAGWSINYGSLDPNEIVLVSVPTLYWTSSNTGTALADNSGNWDTTGGNTVWSTAASSGTAQAWVNGDMASFGAGGTGPVTVTIDTTGITAGGITFNAMGTGGSYTIASAGAGDNLNLTGGTTITMNADATISAPIVGTGALNITGSHTLTLSSLTNSYSGGTIINSGATLEVTGVITGAVVDNGTFDVNDGFAITDLSGNGAMTFPGSAGLSVNTTGADTFSGTLTASLTNAQLAVFGTGSLALTGNLSGFAGEYSSAGSLTLAGSTLLNSSALLNPESNGTINVAYSNLNGNAVTFNGTNGFLDLIGPGTSGTLGTIGILDTAGTTVNTIDAGGGTLTIASPIQSANTGSGGSNTLVLQNGTFILGSTNNVTDFIDNGTLQIGNNAGPLSTVQFDTASNLPASSIGINMEGGELQFTGSGTVTISNAITDTSSNDIIDGGGSINTLTISNSITNATGSTLTLQNGDFILTGTNNSTFSGGSLQIGNGSIGGIVNFAAATNLPGTGASIALGAATLNYTGGIAITIDNAILVSTGSSNVISANAQQLTLSNSITNTGGTLTLDNGTFVLTGTNSGVGEFTGGTLQIGNGTTAGTVDFGASANMPGSGATVAMDIGTLNYTGTGNISLSSPFTLAGANTINTGTGGDLTLFGTVTGTGSLTVNGDGISNQILFIDNTTSYTGTTTITGGTLEFGGDTSGLTGNITDNAALAFLQSTSSSVSGIISGTGSVTEQDASGTTLTLSGNNTYSGTTTITTGTLEFTGDTSGLSGGIVNNSALVFAQSANSSFNQVISGTGSVTQQGTAILTLSAANTYSGNTTVNAGSTLNVTGTLYQGSGLGNVLDNGTMDVANGFTIGSLTGTGTLDLSNTATPLFVTASSIFGGAVEGNGLLEASGTDITLTLNGSLAAFTGSLTSANGGNIVVGTGAGQLASSVSLNISNNLSISLSYGTLASAGNAVNFTGNTGTAGELLVTGTGTGTLGAITITDTSGNTTNTIDGNGVANTLTLNGAITSNNTGGSNTLLLQNGTFVLANANNSADFVGNGNLQIGNGATEGVAQFTSASNLPASTVGIVLNQGILDYTGTGNATVANGITITGANSILENSSTAGTETLTGSITNATASNILAFSGGTFNLDEAGSGSGTFQIGDAPSTVIVSNANAFGSGAILLTTGSTLETSGAAAGSGSTLAITGGNYTQQAGSTLKLLVTGGGNDSIQLGSGNATLNGILDLIFASGSNPAKGDTYTVIGTTGSVTGNFTTVQLSGPGLPGSPILRGVSSFDSGIGEIVTLETQYFLNLSSLTPNEQAVAVYLNNNAIGPNTPVVIQNVLNTIAGESTSQQAAFLDSVTPQAYAQLTEQSIQDNTFLAQQLFQQVENAFDAGGFNTSGLTMLKTNAQDPFTVSMDAAMASAQQQAQNSVAYLDSLAMPGAGPEVPTQESPTSGFSGFVLGSITVDQLPENNGFPDQHFTTGNVLAGLDYRLNRNLVVGALFNWGYTGGTMDSYGSRQQSSSYTPGVFVGYKQGGFYADGLVSYTYNTYKINRNVSSTVATGEPDSNEYDTNALVGYYFPIAKGLQAGPAAGVGFTQLNTSGYSETGSPFDLTIAKQHADSLRSLLGMQALYTFVPKSMPLPININFNAFWQHEFLNSSRDITASFTQLGGGGSFLYNTAGPSRDSALLGLGAGGYVTKDVSLFVNYEIQVGDKNQFAQTVMAGVAVSF